MKIAIDCRSLRKKPAGVPNFLIAAINTLSAEYTDLQIYLLSNTEFSPEYRAALHHSPKVSITISPLPVFRGVATLWYILKTYSILKKLQPDFFYTPIPNLPFFKPRGVRTMITV